MSASVRVAAQAKINLRLKVLDRVESGYHSIETVFVRLDLADEVTVDIRSGRGITVDMSADPSIIAACGEVKQNIAALAAASFCKRVAWHPRLEIGILKAIPMGAGLGGGSADAAAVLRALNAVAPKPLPMVELLSLAATIGSDVPFLVTSDVIALGWGRGERLKSLPPLPGRATVLGVPPIHVSTRDAYGWLGRGRGSEPDPPTLLPNAFASWDHLARHSENDFFDVVAERHPVVREIRDSLIARGARIATLTGSGSVVFGIFDDPPPDDGPPAGAEWSEIRTATAVHVVPVERMD